MNYKNKNLIKRILDISYKNKLSHLGSYFSCLDVIDNVFDKKEEDDIFILSCGHAALALYCVIEKYHKIDAEYLFNKHGGHPHLDEDNKIYCSTGSLGMGITVAIGRAIVNPDKKVYCLISDGETAEGSIWEALRFIKEKNIQNIEIHCSCNGYAAYDNVDVEYLKQRLLSFLPSIKFHLTNGDFFPFLKKLNAHYHIMSENDYKIANQILT